MIRTNTGPGLPAEYADLERFADYWIVDTCDQRIACRSEASMSVIRDFYDAILPRAESILDNVGRHPLGKMPADVERLFKLLLALPHAAMAIEIHGQPRIPHARYPNGLRLLRPPQPYG
jgi:hypothetical protein